MHTLHGPLPQVRLLPTGGVNLQTIGDFLKAGACAVGLGGALVEPQAIKNRDIELRTGTAPTDDDAVVVEVLQMFFHKTETEARQIMLTVHHKGQGVAGPYSRDVADSKVSQGTDFAREHGAPLKLTTEPA